MGSHFFGTVINCEVKKIGTAYGGMHHLYITDVENGKKYHIRIPRGPFSSKSDLPQAGDLIEVNVDNTSKYQPTLNTNHFKKHYSLKKKEIS